MLRDFAISSSTSADGWREYEIEDMGKKSKYISVTTLIGYYQPKEALFKWKRNLGLKALEDLPLRDIPRDEAEKEKLIKELGDKAAAAVARQAAERGTNTHKAIEDKLVEQKESDDTQYLKLQESLAAFEPVLVEKKIYWEQPPLGFGGTVDLNGYLDTTLFKGAEFSKQRELVLGDVKTWSKPKYLQSTDRNNQPYYPIVPYFLQIAAYAQAVEYCTDGKLVVDSGVVFGVAESTKIPYLYYVNKEQLKIYWKHLHNMLAAWYGKQAFDWKAMEQDIVARNALGTRIYYDI